MIFLKTEYMLLWPPIYQNKVIVMLVESEKLLQHRMLMAMKVWKELLDDAYRNHWYLGAMSNDLQMHILVYDWRSCILIIVVREQTSCKSSVNSIACMLRVEEYLHSEGEMWLTILPSSVIEAICACKLSYGWIVKAKSSRCSGGQEIDVFSYTESCHGASGYFVCAIACPINQSIIEFWQTLIE